MGEGCVFCRIALGEVKASVIYEDERYMAFMDVCPVNAGHALVIPKRHFENLYEIPEDEVADLFRLVKNVAISVKKAVNASGITILQSNGEAASQSVPHLHVHVIPRFKGDIMSRAFLTMMHSARKRTPQRQDLDRIADRIRDNL